MTTFIDISILLSYLGSTSNLALSSRKVYRKVRSNGFPIKTKRGDLTFNNLAHYNLLNCPQIDIWMRREFFWAIGSDNVDSLKLLLQGGADVEMKNILEQTALSEAARYDQSACLKLLLKHKADPNARCANGWTPLLTAAWAGKSKSLRLLLEHGADTETKTTSGNTALCLATMYGRINCLKVLLRGGAKVDPWVRENYPQYSELWGDSTL